MSNQKEIVRDIERIAREKLEVERAREKNRNGNNEYNFFL